MERVGLQFLNSFEPGRYKPEMTSGQISFGHGPVSGGSDLVRGVLDRTQEIDQVAILIIDRFGPRRGGPAKQYGKTTAKWFDVVSYISEVIPDKTGDARLSTEPKFSVKGTALLVFQRRSLDLR